VSVVFTLLAIAIPLVVIASILRRAARFTERLRDPTRLQQIFAEHAASALRRAGADPKAIARLEDLTRGKLRRPHAPPAPIALGVPMQQETPLARDHPEPIEVLEIARPLRRAERSRPRPHPSAPLSPLGGLDLGDRFRLSEPPEISEPHGPIGFNANWIAFAALLGGAAYYLLR
jgi:hypothetical protein